MTAAELRKKLEKLIKLGLIYERDGKYYPVKGGLA